MVLEVLYTVKNHTSMMIKIPSAVVMISIEKVNSIFVVVRSFTIRSHILVAHYHHHFYPCNNHLHQYNEHFDLVEEVKKGLYYVDSIIHSMWSHHLIIRHNHQTFSTHFQ
jgi:hypothetical protein